MYVLKTVILKSHLESRKAHMTPCRERCLRLRRNYITGHHLFNTACRLIDVRWNYPSKDDFVVKLKTIANRHIKINRQQGLVEGDEKNKAGKKKTLTSRNFDELKRVISHCFVGSSARRLAWNSECYFRHLLRWGAKTGWLLPQEWLGYGNNFPFVSTFDPL